MKQLIIGAVVLLSLGLANYSNAHEGHDKTPGAVAAPHGGVIQDIEHIYLELLTETNGLKLYPYDHELKPIALKDVKIEGSATFPKKPKAEKVSFTSEGEAFSAKVDSKGAHRYTLDVTITHAGKKEKTKFNVEPQ